MLEKLYFYYTNKENHVFIKNNNIEISYLIIIKLIFNFLPLQIINLIF